MAEHKLDGLWTLVISEEPVDCAYSCGKKTRLLILPHQVCLRCWCHPTDRCGRWCNTASSHRIILSKKAAEIGITDDVARELA